MKAITYLVAIAFFSFISFSSFAQPCTNHVKNNSASADKSNWTTYGIGTTIFKAASNKSFGLKAANSHFFQDIPIPAGSNNVYGGGWSKNTKTKAETGQAYMNAYIMDGGNKILGYLTFDKNTATSWKFQLETASIPAGAKKVRFFLHRSSINGKKDIGNVALFDNIIVSFDCKKKTPLPICKNHLKNTKANKGTANWTSNGSTTIATLAGGNKAFQVLASNAHFSQDVKIPKGSKTAYFGGWTRNSQPNAPTGHAYLYGYVMDANDKILDYVQLGVQNKGMIWTYQDKKVTLAKGATKIRFFLKKSAHATTTDTRNMAYFDNLILSFNCSRKTPQPK